MSSILYHRLYMMVSTIEGRPQEIVHARIHNNKVLSLPLFKIESFGNENPGIPHDRPARLKDKSYRPTFQYRQDVLRQVGWKRWPFILVSDPEPATYIKILNRYALPCEFVYEYNEPSQRINKW